MESGKANAAPRGRPELQPSETFDLYGSQCSLPVIAHLVADTDYGASGIDAVVAAADIALLEPFALIVVSGYLEQGRPQQESMNPAISISSTAVLPLTRSEDAGGGREDE